MENNKKFFIITLIVAVLASSLIGALMGFLGGVISQRVDFGLRDLFKTGLNNESQEISRVEKVVKMEEESSTIKVVEDVSPVVVSVIVSKDLPIVEKYYSNPFGDDEFFRQFFGDDFDGSFGIPQYRQNGTETKEVGGGTGFIVSSDGYIATNKHVVYDEDADYTVLMNDGSKYEAKVLARDPVTDLAILKIEGNDFKYAELGNSSDLKVGQTVIAIGNALGEFRNTVSTGVVSGLSRSIIAGGPGIGSEQLMNLIQTDASINPGNSGGPLLNLSGQVIGINTAMASGAQNIGFAIGINEVKNTIKSVKENGRIVRPWLGVRYAQINDAIKESNKLSVDYGALVVRGDKNTDLAVLPGSPADKAGLREGDIILEINGSKIDSDNPLSIVISKLKPGDEIKLKVIRGSEEKEVTVILEELE